MRGMLSIRIYVLILLFGYMRTDFYNLEKAAWRTVGIYYAHIGFMVGLTSAVNNGEKHLVDFIRQPDGKSLGILEQAT